MGTGSSLQDRRHGGHRRFAAKGAPPADHLVEQGAEGEDIGPAVDGLGLGLLGRHVGGGARDHPLAGFRAAVLKSQRIGEFHRIRPRDVYGQPEVQDLHQPFRRDHDVRRLQVAVDDADRVRLGECVRDLDRITQNVVERQALGGNQLVEAPAGDELHGDEVRALILANLIDMDDVGVIEGRGGAGLLEKTPFSLPVGVDFPGDEFQGDEAVELAVAGLVHDSHPALADGLQEQVARNLPSCQTRFRGRHAKGIRCSLDLRTQGHTEVYGSTCRKVPGMNAAAIP